MPVTDILNPTTVLTNNAVVSSANALAVKVISGGGSSSLIIGSTTISSGTSTRLLYDQGGVLSETPGVTYVSASVTLAFASLAILGFMSSASAVDGGISRVSPSVVAVGNGAAGDFTGTLKFQSLAYGGITFASTVAGSGALVGATNPTLSSLIATGTLTYGGVTLSSAAPTGTGLMVLATSPTLSSVTITTGGLIVSSGNITASTGDVNVAAGNLQVQAGGLLTFGASTRIGDISDGNIRLINNGATSFTMLTWGPATSAFPAMAVASAGIGLRVRNAINSADATFAASNLTLSGTLTYGAALTFASTVTGSGSLVGGTNPTLSSLVATGTLTYGGVTLSSAAPTGTGVMVLATNPTVSSLVVTGTLTYGGVALASTVTGTGGMVLASGASLSGNVQTSGFFLGANGVAGSSSATTVAISWSTAGSFGILFSAVGSVVPTVGAATGALFINTTGSSTSTRMYIRTSASTWTNFTTAA